MGDGIDVEPAHFWSQGTLVTGVRSWQLIINHDLNHCFHGRALGGFHIIEGTDVEPAHFWSQGPEVSTQVPLVNGVRTCQVIIKHDLTHRFQDRTLGVCPVSVFHFVEGTDVELAHFWSQGPLVNGVRSWQFIITHDLTHWFHGRTLGVSPSVQVPHQ